jgi:hypothetical protein
MRHGTDRPYLNALLRIYGITLGKRVNAHKHKIGRRKCTHQEGTGENVGVWKKPYKIHIRDLIMALS